MNEITIEGGENKKNNNKSTVGRISRLFQKKPKKKVMSSSTSTLSISDPTLSTYQSSSSIASSQLSIPTNSDALKRTSSLDSRSLPVVPNHSIDSASNQSQLSRNMSVSSHRSPSIQQLIHQQRLILQELDAQKAAYSSDVTKLKEQLIKTQEKISLRTSDMDTLKNNYQVHLRSVRSSDDDATSIGSKLVQLRQSIHVLASELLPHAEPPLTSEKLSTLWLNLSDSINTLGQPLPLERIQMLTEKFMMDVLVQNLNINIFPGLSCNPEFIQLSNWFEQHDTSAFFSTRLRQELSMLVVQHRSTVGSDIEQTWKKCVDRNWHHLYRGLQKAYPNYLTKDKENQVAIEYGKKLRILVQDTMTLGSAIKGQEVCITAVDVREGVQLFDSNLMEDEDGQTSGTIAFCISPPFVVKKSNRYEPLVKGRVLCFPTTCIPTTTTSTTANTTTTTTTSTT